MNRSIGVIGGVGPYAGVDMVKKVLENTIAEKDQDHIDLYLVSCPSLIPDRTGYLLHGGENPAEGLYACFEKLAGLGAAAAAVACNTAHAPAILGTVRQRARENYPGITLVNMIDETCRRALELFPEGGKIGLLATLGTYAAGVYRHYFDSYPGLELLEPAPEDREAIHQAIYDPGRGIKASSPVTSWARDAVLAQGKKLLDRGAGAIILGCTELPLALSDGDLPCVFIDPTVCAARALIRETVPEKLKV